MFPCQFTITYFGGYALLLFESMTDVEGGVFVGVTMTKCISVNLITNHQSTLNSQLQRYKANDNIILHYSHCPWGVVILDQIPVLAHNLLATELISISPSSTFKSPTIHPLTITATTVSNRTPVIISSLLTYQCKCRI